MKLLLTNDDGIEAPGLQALVKALEKAHKILVAAPASEKSASSHSISFGQKLVIEERAPCRFAIFGTPVDCVKFVLSELKDFKPDLLISGINPAPNTGVSVYYSGTISAAREGLINGVPGLAVSVASKQVTDFNLAGAFSSLLVEGFREGIFPADTLLNVNLPDLPGSEIKGVKIARQAASRFIEEFVLENHTGNRRVYSLAGEIQVFDPDGTTDVEVVSEGFIAVTPLKLDLTDYPTVPRLVEWWKRREASWFNPKLT